MAAKLLISLAIGLLLAMSIETLAVSNRALIGEPSPAPAPGPSPQSAQSLGAAPMQLPSRPRRTKYALNYVVVNGIQLTDQQIAALRSAGITVKDGNFWYDPVSGAYGNVGWPVRGFVQAGLPMGGTLSANASNGHTGVFVNGRELSQDEVNLLASAGVPVAPGNWWLNSEGQYGAVGSDVVLGTLPIGGGTAGSGSDGGYNWGSDISGVYGGGESSGDWYIAGDGWDVANF